MACADRRRILGNTHAPASREHAQAVIGSASSLCENRGKPNADGTIAPAAPNLSRFGNLALAEMIQVRRNDRAGDDARIDPFQLEADAPVRELEQIGALLIRFRAQELGQRPLRGLQCVGIKGHASNNNMHKRRVAFMSFTNFLGIIHFDDGRTNV
jgi:hypothetical protein